MKLLAKFIQTNWSAAITGAMGLAVGFCADIGKERLKHGLRLREEHATEVKESVLTPIFELLKEFYLPACALKSKLLDVQAEQIANREGKIIGDPYVGVKWAIVARMPDRLVPGVFPTRQHWEESESFQRFYPCAKRKHYATLLARWESFKMNFEAMAARCVKHAEKIAQELKENIGVEAHLPSGPAPLVWAQYERLAVLIFQRQIVSIGEGLYLYQASPPAIKTNRTQDQLMQCASVEQANQVLRMADEMAKRGDGDVLRADCKKLEPEVRELLEAFRMALMMKSLPKRCHLA